jgi:hypothetical protein
VGVRTFVLGFLVEDIIPAVFLTIFIVGTVKQCDSWALGGLVMLLGWALLPTCELYETPNDSTNAGSAVEGGQ